MTMTGPTGEIEPGEVNSCWDGESDSTLRQALQPPVVNCVERGLGGGDRATAGPETLVEELALTVKTLSAYRIPIVKVFVEAMAGRTELRPELIERVHTAVQEALMNAVLHGNLKIDSSLRGTLQDLIQMHEAIEVRLAAPEISCAPVHVEARWNERVIHVLVRDAGEGYAGAPSPKCGDSRLTGEKSSGRGLAILDTMCDEFSVIEDGRAAKMSFFR